MPNIEQFIGLARKAIQIMNIASENRDWDYDLDAWKNAYYLIFSSEISRKIANTGIDLDYYDPDSSYEDDVRAYCRALEEKIKEFLPFLDTEKDSDQDESILILKELAQFDYNKPILLAYSLAFRAREYLSKKSISWNVE
jgi:hypothetical protein